MARIAPGASRLRSFRSPRAYGFSNRVPVARVLAVRERPRECGTKSRAARIHAVATDDCYCTYESGCLRFSSQNGSQSLLQHVPGLPFPALGPERRRRESPDNTPHQFIIRPLCRSRFSNLERTLTWSSRVAPCAETDSSNLPKICTVDSF